MPHVSPEIRLKEIYGEDCELDLSKVDKSNLSNSIIGIKCKIHGWQWKYYNDLVSRKAPCSLCVKQAKYQELKIQVIDIFRNYEVDWDSVKSKKHKIRFLCPVHGWQDTDLGRASSNFVNKGKVFECVSCAKEAAARLKSSKIKPNHVKKDWFLQCRELHGDNFDYTDSMYKGAKQPVTVRCKKHNLVFDVEARNHVRLRSGGCSRCKEEAKVEEIIHSVREKTGKLVEITEYKGSLSKVRLFCETHGWYVKKYNSIMYSDDSVCPECKKPSTKKLRQSNYLTKWLEDALAIHGDKFDYSRAVFVSVDDPMDIRCKKHDHWFRQRPAAHLETKHCCPLCAKESMKVGDDTFKSKASFIHKNRYLYGDLNYRYNAVSKRYDVTVYCPKHGTFTQAAHVHLSGYGCPRCARHISNPEDAIKAMVPEGIKVEANTRKVIPPKELDLYFPSLGLAVEYNGLRFHSEIYRGDAKTYHINKTNMCEDKGIQLIHIFEDEYLYREDVVKSKIGYFLGMHSTIAARKTKVVKLDSKVSKSFLNSYHLQGADNAPIRLGLEYQGELVAVMTFSRPLLSGGDRSFEWSLSRFCTKPWISVTGGFSKLLKHFIKESNPSSIQTFADRRWSQGSIYENNGFSLLRITKPNYWYVDMKNRQRVHRFHFRKDRLPKLLDSFDPNKTEVQNMHDNGIYRIWDSGNLVYGWYKRTN